MSTHACLLVVLLTQSDDEGKKPADKKKLAAAQDEEDEGHEFRFAKHRKGWFNRVFRRGEVADESKLLTFKKSLIKKALLKQNRELDEEAVQVFKSERQTHMQLLNMEAHVDQFHSLAVVADIMSYMGDRKSSKPPIEHAK